jgi:hypothetical protein
LAVSPHFNVDYEAAVAGPRRFTQVVMLIVVATFLVLAIGFRSVLVPLKAIALNLLVVAGAFGAVTLVFQDGIGASLLGVAGPVDGIFPAIPVLVFCVVFGLSMDYEVFLVARVREARLAGLGEREAFASGLVHTGRLITSAAAIMLVVFGAFMLGDFLLMKMLGFALRRRGAARCDGDAFGGESGVAGACGAGGTGGRRKERAPKLLVGFLSSSPLLDIRAWPSLLFARLHQNLGIGLESHPRPTDR